MSSAISGSIDLNRAQTQISIDESYKTVQDVSKFDAVELLGHVFVDATADYRASIKLSLVKNGAGTYEVAASDIAGDDYSGSPIVEFQMSGSALQAKIPSGIPGFSSAYVKYSLSAPAAAASDLSVDSENILFDTIVPKDANGISVKNAAGDTTNVFVDDNGNVGIGTDSPRSGYKLHIQESTGNGLNVQAGDASADIVASFGSAGTPDKIVFTAAGDVGIGTSSPTAKLNVFGMSAFVNFTSDWAPGEAVNIAFKQDVPNNFAMSIRNAANNSAAGLAVLFQAHNTALGGSITVRGDNGIAAFNTGSDRRIKKNFEYSFEALPIVKKTKPLKFNWITEDDSRDKDWGFIAQELHEAYPAAVRKGDTEEDIWTVEYSKLVPLLTKAIQELSAKNEELEARLAALESK